MPQNYKQYHQSCPHINSPKVMKIIFQMCTTASIPIFLTQVGLRGPLLKMTAVQDNAGQSIGNCDLCLFAEGLRKTKCALTAKEVSWHWWEFLLVTRGSVPNFVLPPLHVCTNGIPVCALNTCYLFTKHSWPRLIQQRHCNRKEYISWGASLHFKRKTTTRFKISSRPSRCISSWQVVYFELHGLWQIKCHLAGFSNTIFQQLAPHDRWDYHLDLKVHWKHGTHKIRRPWWAWWWSNIKV